MPRVALIGLSLLLPFTSGCFGDDTPAPTRDFTMVRDLATAPDDATGADLAAVGDGGGPVDLAAAPDLASPDLASPDLAVSDLSTPDLAMPDLATPDLATTPADLSVLPPDLADRDALPCSGGYLNSTDPGACPLSCSNLVQSVADEGAFHVPFCTAVSYAHNPPASGNHWPWTAPWGAHKQLVPREWWMHNLEHQGVALLYNCPYPQDGGAPPAVVVEGASTNCLTDGGSSYPIERTAVDNCAADIAKLEALVTSHPTDPWGENRIIVTQDPFLPGGFGAVAWDWSYVADSLDLTAIQCFINARYGRGPENAP